MPPPVTAGPGAKAGGAQEHRRGLEVPAHPAARRRRGPGHGCRRRRTHSRPRPGCSRTGTPPQDAASPIGYDQRSSPVRASRARSRASCHTYTVPSWTTGPASGVSKSVWAPVSSHSFWPLDASQRLDAAAARAGDDGAAVGLEGVHPGVGRQPPQLGALAGVQGEQGRAVGGVDTAVRDRHRPGHVPGLELAAAGGHVQRVHLEGGDVQQIAGDGRGAPDVVRHPETPRPPAPPPAPVRGAAALRRRGHGRRAGVAGARWRRHGAVHAGARARPGRPPDRPRRRHRRRRGRRRRAGRARWAPGRPASRTGPLSGAPARRRDAGRGPARVVPAAGGGGTGGGGRRAPAPAADRRRPAVALRLRRRAAAAARLDQADGPLGQPRGGRTAVVAAGAEEMRGELGLEVGRVGARRRPPSAYRTRSAAAARPAGPPGPGPRAAA